MKHDVVERIGERVDPWVSPEERIAEETGDRRRRRVRSAAALILVVSVAAVVVRVGALPDFDPQRFANGGGAGTRPTISDAVHRTALTDALNVGRPAVYGLEPGDDVTFHWSLHVIGSTTRPDVLESVSVGIDCATERTWIVPGTDPDSPDALSLPLSGDDLPTRLSEDRDGGSVLRNDTTILHEATFGPSCADALDVGADTLEVRSVPDPVLTYRDGWFSPARTVSYQELSPGLFPLVNLVSDIDRYRACVAGPVDGVGGCPGGLGLVDAR